MPSGGPNGRDVPDRRAEVLTVERERRAEWLAGQIDEVERRALRHIVELREALEANTLETKTTREEMGRQVNKLMLTALGVVGSGAVGVVMTLVGG